MIRVQIEEKLVKSFPNVNIAFQLYLLIFVISAQGERSFLKLKRIKNYLRSTMGQARLSALALLSIEDNLLWEMTFREVRIILF